MSSCKPGIKICESGKEESNFVSATFQHIVSECLPFFDIKSQSLANSDIIYVDIRKDYVLWIFYSQIF